MQRRTLAELFEDRGALEPAIISINPPVAVTYRALDQQVEQLAGQLSASGLKRGDCIGTSLPNGLEFLVVFLALARARLVAAPFNPAYKSDELRLSIEHLKVKALVAHSDDATARQAATAAGVPQWNPVVSSSGTVSLAGVSRVSGSSDVSPDPSDDVLFIRTSGTTGKPKVVPLTHSNILASALGIASHYRLTAADRSLVVMPLFHGHGLIGAALSTLSSGGALIVPPRFSASTFWAAFREHRATWYSAVPTIHQVLLARADSDGAPAQGPRFIRSCSAPLAPAVLRGVEDRFGAPLLEAYGMTETSHQVASNPLPPRPHKAGTVGIGTGVELAVIDETGRRLSANARGEVVVRGPGVMKGYRDNPEANAQSFVDGWFRSGDIGVFDSDGYLALTGRIKELINRGGEKISPTEVEAILMEDSAVAEAAVFGVPDPKYGEEVWAAVALKGEADQDRLQALCREHLADFKVPKVIRVVPALPRNATGKIDRRAVAALFEPHGE